MKRGALSAIALACVGLLCPPCLAASDDAQAPPQPPVSVVMVVLDGLPTVSLLDAGGGIDAARYPAFASLADQAVWVPAHSTVATRLLESIPSILTGRYPKPTRTMSVHANHPENLFTWLTDDYRLNVIETESLLMPTKLSKMKQEERLAQIRHDTYKPLNEVDVFRRFIASIPGAQARGDASRPTLHFLHVKLPRSPYRFMPSGRAYKPYRAYGSLAELWSDEPWWPQEAWRRHLLQLRFTDSLLGELLAGLRDAGLYESSLVILTADYGAGFWPGESRRVAHETSHPEDVLLVPLLVKRPGQSKPERIERPAQTIDILPTIADVLGRALPFPVDGCSIFAADCPASETPKLVRIMPDQRRVLEVQPEGLVSRRATLERKLDLFGEGADEQKSFRFGPYAALVGQRAESLARSPEPAGRVRGTPQLERWRAGETSPRVVATLLLEDPVPKRPHVAVVINGRIETVVPAPADRRGRPLVAALVPESCLRAPESDLALFIVRGESDDVVLVPVVLPE